MMSQNKRKAGAAPLLGLALTMAVWLFGSCSDSTNSPDNSDPISSETESSMVEEEFSSANDDNTELSDQQELSSQLELSSAIDPSSESGTELEKCVVKCAMETEYQPGDRCSLKFRNYTATAVVNHIPSEDRMAGWQDDGDCNL